jgi:hypothetical protein
MFDFRRDRGTIVGDKDLEALGAYLDNALTVAERERLEAQLARDANLRAELEQLRILKLQLRAMPRRRAPRSFALDPARYGRPKAQPLLQLYPVLRGATALTAFLLIFTLALGVFRGQFSAGGVAAPAPAEVSLVESAVEEPAPAEEIEQFALEEDATDRETAPTEKAEELPAAPGIEAATEAPAAESAAEAATDADLTAAAVPSPAATVAAASGRATVTNAPEGETLAQEAAPPAEPTIAATVPVAATAPAEVVADTAIAVETAAEPQAESGNTSFLLPLQIGLGLLFVLLLVLWLVARRRARSF